MRQSGVQIGGLFWHQKLVHVDPCHPAIQSAKVARGMGIGQYLIVNFGIPACEVELLIPRNDGQSRRGQRRRQLGSGLISRAVVINVEVPDTRAGMELSLIHI